VGRGALLGFFLLVLIGAFQGVVLVFGLLHGLLVLVSGSDLGQLRGSVPFLGGVSCGPRGVTGRDGCLFPGSGPLSEEGGSLQSRNRALLLQGEFRITLPLWAKG